MEQNIFSVITTTDKEISPSILNKIFGGTTKDQNVFLLRADSLKEALEKTLKYLEDNKMDNVQSIEINNRGGLLIV